jgi:hypothetical protein
MAGFHLLYILAVVGPPPVMSIVMCKKCAFIPLVLAAMLVGCASGRTERDASAKAPKLAKLEMRLNVTNLKELKVANQKGIELAAEIRNNGETAVRLPTRDIGPSWGGTQGGWNIMVFSPDGYLQTKDGFRVPKAESDLAIVELRPREAVFLYNTFPEDETLPAGVIVSYRISKEFGERYGTWSGELTGGGAKLR